MLPLGAVVLDAAGTRPASFVELAGSEAPIPLIMVKSGADAVPLLNHKRVIGELQLRSLDPAFVRGCGEAAEFE